MDVQRRRYVASRNKSVGARLKRGKKLKSDNRLIAGQPLHHVCGRDRFAEKVTLSLLATQLPHYG
jgi:hypothetical protein